VSPTLPAVGERDIRTPDQRLRVFVSSTLGELADERQAVRAAIEQLRLTPVMFELGARPHPPRALYRSYLAQSDVFVGIYWQRYGWVAPDMEISGLEDEFVLSGDLPRLVYVKRPAPDLEPRLAEMLEKLQNEDTASYKPFTDADELRHLLVDDLAILLTERFDGSRGAPAEDGAPGHNLPALTSTFLGREAELDQLRALVAADDVRLITLTGPGGTGKTRLAIEGVRADLGRFADGVFFVDLSAERDAEDAYAAVARTVGVSVTGEVRPLDALATELRDRHTLLVLDNLEQVVSAAVGIAELLERCPNLMVLVTSREALRIRGERVFPVPPLALPDTSDLDAAARSEAVRLFCDRAEAVQPGFRCEASTVEAITAICRLLDGLPLAIELAAARIQLFDVHDLRGRLEDRLDVLKGGARDLPKRQQALRDAIAWSYDLLDPHERDGLDLLAVFSDARLVDVEATARSVPRLAEVDVVEVMGSLVDKSLVRSTHGAAGPPRFSMLQTIRAFTIEQLEADPELASAIRLAHAEHYTDVACELHQRLTLAGRSEVLSALSDELPNVRAAWDEWVARGEVGRLHQLLAPLWGFYEARGDYRSAFELGTGLLGCLASTPDSAERRRDEFVVRMNLVRTELAVRGFNAAGEQIIREALERAESTDDVRQRFPGLRVLAYLHLMRMDFDRMVEVADELMAIAEQEQDPLLLSEAHLVVGLSRAWIIDFPSALGHYDAALEQFAAASSGHVDFRVGPNPGVVAGCVAGLTQWMVGNTETAVSHLDGALDLAATLDHPYSMAYALHHAALLDLWRLDIASVGARAQALLAITEVHDYPTWRALAYVWDGVATVGAGEADAGFARIQEGFDLYQGLSAPPVFWAGLLLLRSGTLGMVGRREEGLRFIREAKDALEEGDPLGADVDIVHGELLLLGPEPDVAGAEECFERAASEASSRGARMAQVRALTHLAVLQKGTSSGARTVKALGAVCDDFTEGLDNPHLLAARAIVDAHASG
jgi:predicted ATPase